MLIYIYRVTFKYTYERVYGGDNTCVKSTSHETGHKHGLQYQHGIDFFFVMLLHWNIVLIEIDTFDGWHVMAQHTAPPQHRWPNQFRAVFATLSSAWFIISYFCFICKIRSDRWQTIRLFFLSPAPPVCVCGKQKKFHLCTLYLWILFVISTVLLCEQSELIRARGVSVCDVRVLRAFHFSSKMTTVCASHLCDTIRFFFSSKNSIVELRHRDYLALTSVVCFCCCRCFVRAKFSRHFARVMSWSKIQLECNKFSWQWNKFAASRRATPRIPCEWAN